MNKHTGNLTSTSRSIQLPEHLHFSWVNFLLIFSGCIISNLVPIFNFSKYIYALAVLSLVFSTPLNLVSLADFINLLFTIEDH